METDQVTRATGVSHGPSSDRRPAVASVTAEVYERLREVIISLALAPGAPLIETDLAARLGVSRTPVRAALLRLQQEGFIHVHHVGHVTRAIVAPLTGEDMRELHFMLGALEGLAVRKAARLSVDVRNRLSAAMEAINRELRAVSEGTRPQVRHAQDLHVRFHRSYVEAAAGPRLLNELNALQPQVERYERVYTGALVHGHHFQAALNEHEEIVDAVKQGDPERAEAAVVANWRNGAQRYIPIVAMLGERGTW
jgi:DNA-binding GntR family transcriptional regulator